MQYPRSYCENSHFSICDFISLLCSASALHPNPTQVMTGICVIMRAIRICAHIRMKHHIHGDNAGIVVKNGCFWAFFTFSNCDFISLLSGESGIGWVPAMQVSTDSHTCWLQIPPIPIRIRPAAAEIRSFCWKKPCVFDLKNCDFISLLLWSSVVFCSAISHW